MSRTITIYGMDEDDRLIIAGGDVVPEVKGPELASDEEDFLDWENFVDDASDEVSLDPHIGQEYKRKRWADRDKPEAFAYPTNLDASSDTCDNADCYVCHPHCTGVWDCKAEYHVSKCASQRDPIRTTPTSLAYRQLGKCFECGFITPLEWGIPADEWFHGEDCTANDPDLPYMSCPICNRGPELPAAISSNGRTVICREGHAWTVLV